MEDVITLAEELANRRRCRTGMAGLVVIPVGENDAIEIRGSRWDERSTLVVTLEDGREFAPEQLVLCSFWKVHCCRPGRWNRWNSRKKNATP